MKIPGSDGNDSKLRRLSDEVSSDKASGGRGIKAGLNRTDDGAPAAPGQLGADSVKVSSLAALLRSELNPARMGGERQQRIEQLKQQIKEGTYQPAVEDIAASVGEELSYEILLSGESSKDDSSI